MEDARERIEREVRRLLDGLGESPHSRLHVTLHDPLIAIVRDLRLSEAERRLVRLGHAEVVRVARREFSEVVCDRYREIIEAATGRRLRSAGSELSFAGDPPWSAETFVIDDAPA